VSTTTKPAFGQPALIGGVVMGVLSALPLVYVGNLCCCLWIISGGVLAAYLLQENQATPIAVGDGALVGLLAGILGACTHLVLSIPIDILMAPYERAIAQRFLDMIGNVPPELQDLVERFSRQGISVGLILIRRLIVFVPMLFVGAIFSTIGGTIGAMIFKKEPPPGVIDIPPVS
jgi:hypothetical protein